MDVIGHPTGRLILKREGYQLTFERIVAAAAAAGVALEINSQVDRLDLDEHHARLAREKGVKLMIDSDAHSPAALGQHALGHHDGAARLARAGRRAQYAAARGLQGGAAPQQDENAMTADPTDKLAEIRRLYFKTSAHHPARLRSRHRPAQDDGERRRA